MSTTLTLQEIIAVMKTAATAAMFKKVEEKKINEKDTADTELPAMYIKLSKTEFNEFLIDTVLEKYFFDLLIVTNNQVDPVSALKTLENDFLLKFLNATEMCGYSTQQKIHLIQSTITNDRDIYAKLGGESSVLSLTIENTNSFPRPLIGG